MTLKFSEPGLDRYTIKVSSQSFTTLPIGFQISQRSYFEIDLGAFCVFHNFQQKTNLSNVDADDFSHFVADEESSNLNGSWNSIEFAR